jgi:uncharacterized protein (TIGR02453 family)
MGFRGFGEELTRFYEGLAADNSKTYWEDHRAVYERDVRGPLLALVEDLEPAFGELKVFRPYRDVRFSKNKEPYKLSAYAAGQQEEGDGGLYVGVDAQGLRVGGGYYMTTTAQARRLREAAADAKSGPALTRVLGGLEKAGFTTYGEELKRIPAPWDASHPRAALLRYKTLTAMRGPVDEPWVYRRECLDVVSAAFRELGPLNRWLGRHVGTT